MDGTKESATKKSYRAQFSYLLQIRTIFPSFKVKEFRIKESGSPRIPPEEIKFDNKTRAN